MCYVPEEKQKSVGLSAARLFAALHWRRLFWSLYPLGLSLCRFLFVWHLMERSNQWYCSHLSNKCNPGNYFGKEQALKTLKSCLAVCWLKVFCCKKSSHLWGRTNPEVFTKTYLSYCLNYSSSIWKHKKEVKMCLEANNVNKVSSNALDLFFPLRETYGLE